MWDVLRKRKRKKAGIICKYVDSFILCKTVVGRSVVGHMHVVIRRSVGGWMDGKVKYVCAYLCKSVDTCVTEFE